METVNITRTEVLREGTNHNTGKSWTLFGVYGTRADGSPLEPCKTFVTLGLGPHDVILEPDPRDPNTTMLSLPKSARSRRPANSGAGRPANSRQPVNFRMSDEEIVAELADLRERVEMLEALMKRRARQSLENTA